jgi:6-phosphogluconolactonase
MITPNLTNAAVRVLDDPDAVTCSVARWLVRIHFFWTDGRFVPRTEERNNYKIARDLLVTRVPIPCENIHAIPTTEKTPSTAAPAYEEEITRFHGMSELAPDRRLFDVTFLGIGEEGHTASLFPGSLLLEERSCWVAAVPHGVPEARVALAYPALESSCRVVFAVTAAAKREMGQAIRDGSEELPPTRFKPSGRTHWFFDRAAVPDGSS